MSALVDIGDAFELTFATTTGAAVTYTWTDPGGETVVDHVSVAEDPPGSGLFPQLLAPDSAGMWTATFTASGAATEVEHYYVRAAASTGLPPFASVGDITAQFGPLTPAQETTTRHLLKAASDLVRHFYPLVGAQILAGRLNPNIVALAVSNMVLRVLRNPDGLRAETVGPFSRSYDYTVAAGLLVIGPDEGGLLSPGPIAATSSFGGVGTIRVIPGMAPKRDRRLLNSERFWHGWH